jgi:hypothetical protein
VDSQPMVHGEMLVRKLISELDTRVAEMNAAYEKGNIGPRTARARTRILRADYEKLCVIARRWGFNV